MTELKVTELRVLTLDIETRPAIVHSWGLYNQNHGLNQVVEPGRVICFGAKWLGQKKVMFFSEYDAGGSQAMAEAAHRLLSEADILVTYNGVSFDVKWLHSLITQHGLKAPQRPKDCDLLKVVKKNFRFLSNKLQHVADQLDLGQKLQTGGHELWTGWMEGDEKAIRKMTRYCKQDVRLTEDLFTYLREHQWLPANVFPPAAIGSSMAHCPHDECGSTALERHGYKYTSVGRYQRWLCKSCGRTATERRADATSKLKGI